MIDPREHTVNIDRDYDGNGTSAREGGEKVIDTDLHERFKEKFAEHEKKFQQEWDTTKDRLEAELKTYTEFGVVASAIVFVINYIRGVVESSGGTVFSQLDLWVTDLLMAIVAVLLFISFAFWLNLFFSIRLWVREIQRKTHEMTHLQDQEKYKIDRLSDMLHFLRDCSRNYLRLILTEKLYVLLVLVGFGCTCLAIPLAWGYMFSVLYALGNLPLLVNLVYNAVQAIKQYQAEKARYNVREGDMRHDLSLPGFLDNVNLPKEMLT